MPLATRRGPAGGFLDDECKEVLLPSDEPPLSPCSGSMDPRGWGCGGSREACALESELVWAGARNAAPVWRWSEELMQRMDGRRQPRMDWKGSKGGCRSKLGGSVPLDGPLPGGTAALDDRFPWLPWLCSAPERPFAPSPPGARRCVALALAVAHQGGVPSAPLLLLLLLGACLSLPYAAGMLAGAFAPREVLEAWRRMLESSRLCSVLRLLALQFPPPLSSETRAAPEATEFETVLLALRAMPALGLPPWKKAAEWRAEGLTAEWWACARRHTGSQVLRWGNLLTILITMTVLWTRLVSPFTS